MRILVLSPWFPAPPDNGSRLRAFHLIRELAVRGHTLRLVTGIQEDIRDRADTASLESFCEKVITGPWAWHDARAGSAAHRLLGKLGSVLTGVPRSLRETENAAFREAVMQEGKAKPDALLAFELAAAPYIPVTPRPAGRIVLDQVEFSSLHVQKGGGQGVAERYWRKTLLAGCDAITVVSRAEQEAAQGILGETLPILLLENGVATGEYQPEKHAPIPGRMIYTGSLSYGPNAEAVAWFVTEILPRIAAEIPEAHLVITGRYTPEESSAYSNHPRVHLTGFLPGLRPALAEAALCVVPLLRGGGTRLKVLEAWAAGVPVVSTTIGVAGLEADEARHYLGSDTAEEFAALCIRLLRSPERGRTLAENARHLVESRYDWRDIAARLEAILASPRSA